MAIYKRGSIYWHKFTFNGEAIRESTRQKNQHKAKDMESTHRSRLAMGEVGIREKKRVPTLSEFMEKDFVPYVETKHAEKPGTVEYYTDGSKMVCGTDLGSLRLDEVNDQHAQRFASQKSKLSASRINCGLRTLRRALNLAYQWGTLERPAKVTFAKGERQRDRVLTDTEVTAYLAACPQPWRDAATIIRGTGMRPGEVFTLRWERVLLTGERGLLQVSEGKSKAAKRILPLVPAVYAVLERRKEEQGKPEEGWVFPSNSAEGHLNGDTTKDQHAIAVERSRVARFEPYILRHTALTRLAESGCDVFTLARIAGHSSITITQRYVHPQADAVDRAFKAFGKLGTGAEPKTLGVGTILGTIENCQSDDAL
jgi:integrase